jgi:hypothetical protein
MQYIDDLENATVEELEAAEAEWRDTVRRQAQAFWFLDDQPTAEDWLDNLQEVKDAALDIVEWGKVAEALVEARSKEKVSA